MATRQLGVWGIDLGQCALKAVRLEMKEGQVVATAFEYIEHPKILSQPDADPDELTREALTQFLSRNSIRYDVIAISVPGQSGLARFVKLPPVTQSKIADIVKFEAKQQIPFPLEEVVWDFQPLSTGEVVDGMAMDTEIGLFAMKRDMVNRAVNQFKDVNVEVHLVQMAPLALCNYVSYDLLGKDTSGTGEEEEDHSCIVALEIGTDSSNLVITDGGKIIWQRPIPIGGNHFTRALTKEMKLTFAKAEHLKRNAAKSPELKKILSALKQVLNDFVGEVQRSLGYFTNTHRNAQIQYMIGLGNAFRLPGLQKFLQEKLQLEVRKLHDLQRASGESVTEAPVFTENIMSFAVAYGLALQGLKQAKLQTNLLPHEVRMERLVRGKKPWLVTAAATLLIGMFLLAFARGMEKTAVVNPDIDRSKKDLESVMALARTQTANYKTADDNLKKHLESLNRISAGVNERFNWQLLHEYINVTLPQPNGDRLVTESKEGFPVKSTFWDKKAQDAFSKWKDKRYKKKGDSTNPAQDIADELLIKQHLVQINVIGINALYTDDLGPYFRKIQNDGNSLMGMHAIEKKQIDEFVDEKKAAQSTLFKEGIWKDSNDKFGKDGWVVEILGYTYHHKKNEFIQNTLGENLKYPGQFKDKNGKDLITPDMKKVIGDRLGYLNLYKLDTVAQPVAGKFRWIDRSYLKTLIKGMEAKTPGAPVPPDPNAALKMDRGGWAPLGDIAKSIYRDFQGGAAAVAPIEKVDPNQAVVPRTEFVLLFVWREPITTQIGLTPEKKN